MNTAIIVAAGSGTRFGGERPKQFQIIHEKPVIQYSLERFAECDAIDEIVIVVAAAEADGIARLIESSGISKRTRIIVGGATRPESVRNGVAAIESDGVVAVHDAARPMVTTDEIMRTVGAAEKHGAACLVAPVVDTIKTVAAGEISATLDRMKLRRALTPQAFRVELLRRAFDSVELDERVTDECYLIEKLGHPIVFVEGSARNIKITVEDDMIVAKAFLAT